MGRRSGGVRGGPRLPRRDQPKPETASDRRRRGFNPSADVLRRTETKFRNRNARSAEGKKLMAEYNEMTPREKRNAIRTRANRGYAAANSTIGAVKLRSGDVQLSVVTNDYDGSKFRTTVRMSDKGAITQVREYRKGRLHRVVRRPRTGRDARYFPGDTIEQKLDTAARHAFVINHENVMRTRN